MKLVVFFRSSKPGKVELLKATVRFALVGVCYISEEHARLSGPPHHRDTLGEERFLVSCACVHWACCGRNAVVPKPPGRACQEGGLHPSSVWGSALFWWWWSFPGNGCWLMVALLAIITRSIAVLNIQYSILQSVIKLPTGTTTTPLFNMRWEDTTSLLFALTM